MSNKMKNESMETARKEFYIRIDYFRKKTPITSLKKYI